MKQDDGGMAFPRPYSEDKSENGRYTFCPQDGATLLDYFAGDAMQAFLSGPEPKMNAYLGNMPPNVDLPQWVAISAYDYATAMVAEKRRREKE